MNRASGHQWIQNEQQGTGPAETEAAAEDWSVIKSRVAAISRASRYPKPWAYCLQRSLALREWLAKDGIFTEVKYGVRRHEGSFDAHAWVVYDGKIVNDSVRHVSTFAPLQSFDDYGRNSSRDIRDALVASKSVGEARGESAGEAV